MNKNQRIALAEKDLQVKHLGQLLDRHPNHVSNVLSGKHLSPQLRKEIAKVLEKPESYLWPEQVAA
ncbi:MAG: hypothetical protein JRD05_01975 [Deltaproteobacteria bacterium]|nr:hypothetical protein [Deltaproteobacteria bacterium]